MTARKQTALAVSAWIMAVLMIGGITYAFNKANHVEAVQVAHNIDKEAHPTIAGRLELIDYKLDEILKSVNGDK